MRAKEVLKEVKARQRFRQRQSGNIWNHHTVSTTDRNMYDIKRLGEFRGSALPIVYALKFMIT